MQTPGTTFRLARSVRRYSYGVLHCFTLQFFIVTVVWMHGSNALRPANVCDVLTYCEDQEQILPDICARATADRVKGTSMWRRWSRWWNRLATSMCTGTCKFSHRMHTHCRATQKTWVASPRRKRRVGRPSRRDSVFLETLRGGFCLGVYQVAEVFIAKTRGTEAPISQYGSLVSENSAPCVKTNHPTSWRWNVLSVVGILFTPRKVKSLQCFIDNIASRSP